MKTLVIHPKDNTTDFLAKIYSDKDWTIINANTSNRELKKQIKAHDRIVMLGHGTQYGLIGYGKLVVDSSWVYLLRDKQCVCIWCNADLFVTKYGLKGFYTGMIISESEEAMMYAILCKNELIEESNSLFAAAIKESIDSENMVASVKGIYQGNNVIIKFNQNHIYHEA